MRTVDRLTVDEIGIPAAVLMERAGLGAAADVLSFFPEQQRIAIICGPGNNGGDGFVVARHLSATGRQVEILLVEAESKVRRESKVNLEIARRLEIPVQRINATAWKAKLREFDLIVDAMLGTGVTGAPRPNVEVVIRAIELSRLPVVALDIPTGIDASTGAVETVAVRADLTLTFHGPKIGLAVAPGRFHAGRVKVVDVGIPAGVEEPQRQGVATPLLLGIVPGRERWDNKYSVGTVCCVGGAVGMAGAINLTTRAAARAGAGVVWGVVPEPIAADLDVLIPEVQFRGAIADEAGRLTVGAVERIEELASRATAVVFGPGIGDTDQTRALSRWAIKNADKLVLDAQALGAFAGQSDVLAEARDGRTTLLTPHEGEIGKLLDRPSEWVRGNRLEAAQTAALQTRCHVALKGEDTIVCAPGGDFLVCGGHSSAATAGSGDVFAGVAGAMLARGLDPFLAGACTALACGLAAEGAACDLSPTGVIASDMVDHLPAALAGRLPDGAGG